MINEAEDFSTSDDNERHAEVFLKNVQEHKVPFANAETGHYASNVGHLMNVSWLVGGWIR